MSDKPPPKAQKDQAGAGKSLATLAAQACGQSNDATGGVVGGIDLSTTFERDEAYALPASGDTYRRDQNATVREAEAVISALEGAHATRLFGSGLAAISALMRAAGGQIIIQDNTYFGVQRLADARRLEGQTLVRAPIGDTDELERLCSEVRPALIIIETPSNPLLDVVDIAACAQIAEASGAMLAVDSTAATPILTRPLGHGAHIVLHSATKGLNGHSDVVAGAVCVGALSEMFERVCALRASEGAILSPFDAFLLTRGMRTIALRVPAASRSALTLAERLAHHRRVVAVRYPGLASHKSHDVARRQMADGFGCLLAFEMASADDALRVCGKLRLIKRATSLGGVETLIEHRRTVEPQTESVPEGLLRLSVGIEDVDDLWDDLSRALS